MKRLANYLIAMVLMAFTFTSCEDVPNPFGQILPPDKTEDGGGSGGTTSVIKENFKEAGKVTWAINNVNVPAGAEVWTYDSKYGMKATAYIGGANNAAESWLISPAYDLSNVTGATLSIHHAANYFANGADKECAVMVSTDYKSGAPSTATWKAITIDTWPSSWTFVDGTGSMSDFDGKSNVCIALKYTSTAEKSGTWEVESIEITGGGSASGGGDTPTPSGNHGTADAPLTVAQAMALIDAESTIDEAYVKGKISQIDSYSSQYKSITYWISDDGGTTTQLEVYSGKGLNGADFAAKEDLAVGQTVVVKGALKKFKETYEFDKTSSIISIEGGSGGGDTPAPTGGTMTKDVNGAVVTLTSTSVTGSDEVTVDFNAQGWASETAPTTVTLDNGTTIEFGAGENESNSPKFYSGTKGVRVYAKNIITIKGTKPIAKVAMNCDSNSSTNYVGNELLYAKEEGNNVTICNDHTEAKGGVQLRVQTMVITFEGEGTGGGGDTPSGDTGLEASFASGLGDFTIDDKAIGSLSFVWKADNKGYMKASAYVNNANNAAESWLVSPAFSLKGVTAPTMTFNNAVNYVKTGTITDHIKVLVYDGTNWAEVTIANLPDGASWTFVDSTVDLKDYAGKENVKIAFKYVSTTAVAPTWEIKTVSIK